MVVEDFPEVFVSFCIGKSLSRAAQVVSVNVAKGNDVFRADAAQVLPAAPGHPDDPKVQLFVGRLGFPWRFLRAEEPACGQRDSRPESHGLPKKLAASLSVVHGGSPEKEKQGNCSI